MQCANECSFGDESHFPEWFDAQNVIALILHKQHFHKKSLAEVEEYTERTHTNPTVIGRIRGIV